ncbi:iron-containing alcohol dehydrogenase [candidate division WOR-3 bacterium]|nr:iron-containing alcohol dehydrogenase [candidate division WOR-3 bacterium]
MENTAEFLRNFFSTENVKKHSFSNLSLPKKVCLGEGSFDELEKNLSLFGKKVFLVTGSQSFCKSDYFTRMTKIMAESEIKYCHVKIPSEPTVEMIDFIRGQHKKQRIDAVIAVGGGSVLDAGKAISALIYETEPARCFLENLKDPKKLSEKKIPFIAVPTTSGTGSEATKNAVLSIPDLKIKASLRDEVIIPDVAIIDPLLTYSLSERTAFSSGMDALTQLAESFISVKSCKETDFLAGEGFRRAFAALKDLTHDFCDKNAKNEMSLCAFISGITLANAGLGPVHGFAAVIGGMFDVPHGIICANLLRPCLKKTWNLCRENKNEKALDKFRKLAGFSENSDCLIEEEILFENLEKLLSKTGLEKLESCGVKEENFRRLSQMTSVKNNPSDISVEGMMEILGEEKNRS